MIVDTLSTLQIVPSLSRLKVWQDGTQQERTPPPPPRPPPHFLDRTTPHLNQTQTQSPFLLTQWSKDDSSRPPPTTIPSQPTTFVPRFHHHPSRLPTNTIAIPSTLTSLPWTVTMPFLPMIQIIYCDSHTLAETSRATVLHFSTMTGSSGTDTISMVILAVPTDSRVDSTLTLILVVILTTTVSTSTLLSIR